MSIIRKFVALVVVMVAILGLAITTAAGAYADGRGSTNDTVGPLHPHHKHLNKHYVKYVRLSGHRHVRCIVYPNDFTRTTCGPVRGN